ncbi:MAG: Fic family protein [Erysipelotrichaceae bacterium]
MEMENKSGYYQENRRGRRRYRPYFPYDLTTLDNKIALNVEMMKKISNANFALGTLDGAGYANSRGLGIMTLLEINEGVNSLKLEGYHSTVESYLVSQLHQRKSDEELLLDRYMLCLKDGQNKKMNMETLQKMVNQFLGTEVGLRKEQTFIRYLGRDPFAPCKVETLPLAIQGYENYVASKEEFDELIKAALLQYEIFTIQPFEEGNGLLQRFVSIVYLMNHNRLPYANLALSDYFLKHKLAYEKAICSVSETGNFEEWIQFFLEAVKVASINSMTIIINYDKMLQKHMSKISESAFSDTIQAKLVKLLAYLQDHPVVEVKTTAKDLRLSFNTAANLIQILSNLGLLKQVDDRNRNRYFLYIEMLNLLEV